MAGRLREGIYEHVVTRGLAASLEGVGDLKADLAAIEKVDLPRVLARHIAREIEVRLRGLAEPEEQVTLANALLAALEASDDEEADDTARVDRAERLHAIYRALPPARPMTPLGESTLLTRSSKDPVLGHELKSEIASCDTVDVIARASPAELSRTSARLLKLNARTDAHSVIVSANPIRTYLELPSAPEWN